MTRGSLQAVIDGVLEEVNQHLSTYDPKSEISAFNASRSTDAIVVSPQLREVVAISAEVSAVAGGAFDITVGSGTGYQKLELPADVHTLRKVAPELELDVDGVAPGYAVDLIAGRFEALGVHDYLVELGGEVRANGQSPAGRPWRVAVEVPLGGEREPYTLVELDGVSVSTSGDYRDFRIVEGRRLSHTIDPRTGTLRFTDAAFDVRTAGKELGARYVMEGSLRQTGTQLRVTVQLVDAVTGAHLWAETYERGFGPESAFVTQDELVPRIVATIADVHGILPRSMSAVLRMAGL